MAGSHTLEQAVHQNAENRMDPNFKSTGQNQCGHDRCADDPAAIFPLSAGWLRGTASGSGTGGERQSGGVAGNWLRMCR